MYGSQVKELSVLYRFYNAGKATAIYSVSREIGDYWMRASVSLNFTRNFQIIFQAVRGNGIYGDIAIDDVSFTPGCVYGPPLHPPPATTTTTLPSTTTLPHKCNLAVQFNCRSNGACIKKQQVCDFHTDCADGSDESHCAQPLATFTLGALSGWIVNNTKMQHTRTTYTWKAVKASSSHDRYHPTTDHTSGTNGWYLWIDSSLGKIGDVSEFYTPPIGQSGPQCQMSLFYFSTYYGIGYLKIFTSTNGQRNLVWTSNLSGATKWEPINVFLGSLHGTSIVIQVTHSFSTSSGMALDDVRFSHCEPLLPSTGGCLSHQIACMNGVCIDKKQMCDFSNDCGDNSDETASQCGSSYPGRCDFEFGTCNTWTNDKYDDNFNWQLTQGASARRGTGPSTDHTLRTPAGHYAYMSSSYPQKTNDKARLSSLILKAASKECNVRFWYMMWGRSVGTLNVYKRFNYSSSGMQSVHSFKGNQGNSWYLARFPVTNRADQSGDFQVVLEAVVGRRYYSDIAIDDLSMTPGCLPQTNGVIPGQPSKPPPTPPSSCGAGNFMCNNTKCYGPQQHCNFVNDCGDNSDESGCGTTCDFESGMCGWYNSKQDSFDWTLRQGTTPSANTGPNGDHSLGTTKGHFMYVETSHTHKVGDFAHLMSHIYSMSGPQCTLSFWYSMNGATVGTLKVLLSTSQMKPTTVFKKVGNQGKKWLLATIPIGSHVKFSVVFEAILGKTYTGDIAIDDVKFDKCGLGFPVKTCRPGQFLCDQHDQCINNRYKCDGRADCQDGSDELASHCQAKEGSCNFDNAKWLQTCSWTQSKSDDADWIQASSSPSILTGPHFDHSHTTIGKFVYINGAKMKQGDTAILSTPQFPASNGVCFLRFFYYMFGAKFMGTLQVYLKDTTGVRQLVWTVSDNQGQKWIYANIPVGSNLPFSVLFVGTRGHSPLSDIAIDDVSFTPECAIGGPVTVNTTSSPCSWNQLYCKPLMQCYPKSWKCDGVVDCPDETDEPTSCANETTSNVNNKTSCNGRQFYCKPQKSCLPFKVKCNGKFDCPDHSDEQNCPVKTFPTTRVTHTLPPQTCAHGLFTCADGSCIQGSYLCDGVPDCKNKEDEDKTICDCRPGYILCAHEHNRCIDRKFRCNGHDDCGDGSDESLCKSCVKGFCLNGACSTANNTRPACKCNPGYTGYRCSNTLKLMQTPAPNNKVWAIPVGVIAAVLLIVGLVVAVFFVNKRRQARQFEISTGMSTRGIGNPVYDYGTDLPVDLQMNDFETPTFSGFAGAEGGANPTGTAIENPLYSEAGGQM